MNMNVSGWLICLDAIRRNARRECPSRAPPYRWYTMTPEKNGRFPRKRKTSSYKRRILPAVWRKRLLPRGWMPQEEELPPEPSGAGKQNCKGMTSFLIQDAFKIKNHYFASGKPERKGEGYCSRCNTRVQGILPKHNQYGICPKCRQRIQYKSKKMQKRIIHKAECTYFVAEVRN